MLDFGDNRLKKTQGEKMLTCEACGHEIESKVCSCGGVNLADAKFCSYCGSLFQVEQPDLETESGDDLYDLQSRTLCSDDTCIGIISEQGVCTECGKPADPSG
jgi:transcription elongation factor Elf1